MKQFLLIIYILFFSSSSNSQNSQEHSDKKKLIKVTHELTPFNGMHSGFKPDGTTTQYSAQVATMKRVVDFTPQNDATNPPNKTGYFQMLYDQAPNENLIQVRFSLPPGQKFIVELNVETNVENSSFNFAIDGTTKTTLAKKGLNTLQVSFNGNTTGQYGLLINPEYKMDATTFLLTRIKIITP